MKTPHHKAFEYHHYFVSSKGVPCVAKKYIAIVPGVDIEMLIKRWNMAATQNQKYLLKGEVDLKTALYTRSLNGSSIAMDWKLLDHMQFHSIEFELNEIGVH